MGSETFDRADLAALSPGLSAEQAARMRAAARRVDAARLPEDPCRWDWRPDFLRKDPPGAGVQLIVLGTTLTLFNNLSDWLELTLCIVREQWPRLTVSATVEVACWCDSDHNVHAVRDEQRLVGTRAALTEAFESAGEAIVHWAVGAATRPAADAGPPTQQDRPPLFGLTALC